MKLRSLAILMLVLIPLTGCAGQAEIELDPVKGMDLSFCSALKPVIKETDEIFWALGKEYSMEDFLTSMLEVISQSNAVASVSVDPAQTWLSAVALNGSELMRFYTGDDSGGSEDLIARASRWKASVQEMSRYCR